MLGVFVFIIVTFWVGVEFGWIRQVYFVFHDLILEGNFFHTSLCV